MPVHEQLTRVWDAKEPGRKHQHRKGVKAKERDKQRARNHTALITTKRKAFIAKVRAYWQGLRDTYPT